MFNAVYDHILIIAEDDVAVFAHDLNDKGLAAEVAKLIQVFNLEINDTFQSWLCDRDNPSVAQMLAQKHAEVRSRHWARLVLAGEIDQWKAGAR